ncbi:hypothetical protein HZA41_00095 [Candidatus Peregrinibacteria bacterium]|nr:hypothetical protein [Candidatus Peregrinibacteria bacterium]
MIEKIPRPIRFLFGIIALFVGIIGLVVPVLQGWFFLALALHLIHPEKGKIWTAKAKDYIKKWRGKK